MSDLSAIHHREPEDYPTARGLWRIVDRLAHYPGAVRDIVVHEIRTRGAGTQQVVQPDPAANPSDVVELGELTEAQVDEMRAQARHRRFPSSKFGEHKQVPIERAAEVSRAG